MLRVFKYPLAVIDRQQVPVKGYINTLLISEQNNIPCMWCLVDDTIDEETILDLVTHGTGHEAEDVMDAKYLGTYFLYNRSFVAHVWVVNNESIQ